MPLGFDAAEHRARALLADAALTFLSFVFLVLLLIELLTPLTPSQSRWLSLAGWLIWVAFTLDFVIRFALAPAKVAFLRRNWLAALAIVLPFVRVLRAARVLKLARTLRLARLVTGANRARAAAGRVLGVGGVGYVAAVTVIVWLAAAAGITWLERGLPGAAIGGLGSGLWWSATTILSLGSEQHPASPEGRALAVLVMGFGLGVQGYLTALLAAIFVARRPGRSADETDAPSAARQREYVPARGGDGAAGG